MQLTEERLNELKELAALATPGPWEHISQCGIEEIEDSNHFTMVPVNDHDNAAFIAAASSDVVLALIEELEVLRANNYGPDILNNPDALTTAYFAGMLAEGRKTIALGDMAAVLDDRVTRLEKEADWLAAALSHVCRNSICEECVLEDDACQKGRDWRTAARMAVEEHCQSQ